MTLIFLWDHFLCTVCTGWVSSIPVSMSGISVKNSWPNCSPGHRLHITVKHRATVVKMKGRSGGKDHINDTECGRYFRESAQMGVGGGLYLVYHFWPRIGGQNSSSCSLPPQRKEGSVYLPTHGVCLCLRPNLIPGFSGVDWGWGGGCISFLTSYWRPK